MNKDEQKLSDLNMFVDTNIDHLIHLNVAFLFLNKVYQTKW